LARKAGGWPEPNLLAGAAREAGCQVVDWKSKRCVNCLQTARRCFREELLSIHDFERRRLRDGLVIRRGDGGLPSQIAARGLRFRQLRFYVSAKIEGRCLCDGGLDFGAPLALREGVRLAYAPVPKRRSGQSVCMIQRLYRAMPSLARAKYMV